jgi:hypothetical protein
VDGAIAAKGQKSEVRGQKMRWRCRGKCKPWRTNSKNYSPRCDGVREPAREGERPREP